MSHWKWVSISLIFYDHNDSTVPYRRFYRPCCGLWLLPPTPNPPIVWPTPCQYDKSCYRLLWTPLDGSLIISPSLSCCCSLDKRCWFSRTLTGQKPIHVSANVCCGISITIAADNLLIQGLPLGIIQVQDAAGCCFIRVVKVTRGLGPSLVERRERIGGIVSHFQVPMMNCW